MRATITISIPAEVKQQLDKATRDEGLSRSDIVREALRDYLFIRKFRRIRQRMVERAQLKGVFTDQDVFDRVS